MSRLPIIDVYCLFWPDWLPFFGDLLHLLDPQEMAIAARYSFDNDRRRFVICHGCLRRILGERLKAPPRSLEILLGRDGKPFAAGNWQFNLSYGGSWAIIAIAERIPIGVDLELFRQFPEAVSIARNYFSPDEHRIIESTTEPKRSRTFLTLWTRKEAYLKATGRGLTASLDEFSVGLEAPWIFDNAGCRWGLANLPCLATHAAALCAPGRWRWRQRPLPQL